MRQVQLRFAAWVKLAKVRSGVTPHEVSSVRRYGASSSPTLATVTSRDNFGRITGMTLTGGATTTRSYDVLGRLETLTAKPSATGPTQTRTWTYDARGRVETLTRSTTSGSSRVDVYGYQEPGWLTSEDTDIYGANAAETNYVYESHEPRVDSRRGGQERREFGI